MIIKRLFSSMVKKSLQELGDDIPTIGISSAFKKTLNKYNTKVQVNFSPESKTILQEKPVILVSNHPYVVEPFALLAVLPKREDVFIIAYSLLTGISSQLDKHIIPAYVRHHIISNKVGLLSLLVRELEKDKGSQLSAAESHLKNIESIRKASQVVSHGALVMIFPNPGKLTSDNKWFNGIGYLVKGIKNKKNTYIMMANIAGSSKYDFLRIVPVINRLFPAISVIFSSPLLCSTIVGQQSDPKKITSILENRYNNWIASLIR